MEELNGQSGQEFQSLRNRLSKAFASVTPSDDARQRVLAAVSADAAGRPGQDHRHSFIKLHWRVLSTVTAAAAVVLLAAPLIVQLAVADKAFAAETLAQMHVHNTGEAHAIVHESDPAKLAEYFRQNLGFVPSMPKLGQGQSMRGCCFRHFRKQVLGSYIVDTPNGAVSVFATKESPKELGMKEEFTHTGRTFQSASFGHCNIITTGDSGYTYVAVAELPHPMLTQFLLGLFQENREQPLISKDSGNEIAPPGR